jgi:hypothetical protein
MRQVSSALDIREASSFRDPAGYLFWRNGKIYRCVLEKYRRQFVAAEESGLLKQCTDSGDLLPFTLSDIAAPEPCVAILEPRQLPFISYPYEWSFDQLQDAALSTLDLHLKALEKGMLLKDASAYNIQFVDGRPVLIDHLSFDFVADHGAWPAYGQFCRHFLAPLALMSYVDLGLSRLLQLHIDGIPLDLASAILPRKSWLKFGITTHLHLHAKLTTKYAGARTSAKTKALSAEQLSVLAQSLRSTIKGLRPLGKATEWGAYYTDTNYSREAFETKHTVVRELVEQIKPSSIWDIGGNDGHFSRTLVNLADRIVCMDIDPVAVAKNYRACKQEKIENVLPLVLDLCNPSPGLGFANEERLPILKRGHPSLVIALALIHHIVISNNVLLEDFARVLSNLTDHLIIEFVGKEDSQVQRLLVNRMDIFDSYTQAGFEAAFGEYFDFVERKPIPDSHRILYLLKTKASVSDNAGRDRATEGAYVSNAAAANP